MGVLSGDLKDLGYDRTERESPFDEQGTLWENAYELVCDETGFVIRKDSSSIEIETDDSDEKIYRYRNSGRVKLMGGYPSSYEWGETDEGFTYGL